MNKEDAEKIGTLVQEANGLPTSMKVQSISVEAVVHRAATDTDEDMGTVSYYNRNPFKHYPINFMIWLRGIKRQWLQF